MAHWTHVWIRVELFLKLYFILTYFSLPTPISLLLLFTTTPASCRSHLAVIHFTPLVHVIGTTWKRGPWDWCTRPWQTSTKVGVPYPFLPPYPLPPLTRLIMCTMPHGIISTSYPMNHPLTPHIVYTLFRHIACTLFPHTARN